MDGGGDFLDSGMRIKDVFINSANMFDAKKAPDFVQEYEKVLCYKDIIYGMCTK